MARCTQNHFETFLEII